MASHLQALKQQLLSSGTQEEKVQVNQRHLIDKILARYSAEFTIFRELLQNSNDAGASSVIIEFTTNQDKKPLLSFPWSKPAIVDSIIYRNNGRPFSEEDFARLRKIAEGNPDEQKIGFFGVGFYSLFSICEEPFVSSGNQTMAFFWKDDMLFTKRGASDAAADWTTFFLPTRELISVPETNSFARFLSTSLAFATNIKECKFLVDSNEILHFQRNASVPRQMEVPRWNSYQLTSRNKLFKLTAVEMSKIQIHLKMGKTEHSVFLRVVSGSIDVFLPRKLSEEMNRTLKKNPPSKTILKVMFSNFDEYESSATTRGSSDSIFRDVLIDPNEQGHVFIGFPTHQTVGCSIHLAGHFIPTVERESLDFVDKVLCVWNQDLLSMGGLLARIVCEYDLEQIDGLFSQLSLDEKSSDWINKKAAHTLNSFTFNPSTPTNIVGQVMCYGFVSMSSDKPRILSSSGISSAALVRLPSSEMQDFIKITPVVPQYILDNCSKLVTHLKTQGLLQSIGPTDVILEVKSRVFSMPEITALFSWIIRSKQILDMNLLNDLKKNLRYKTDEYEQSIQTVTHFTSAKLIPPNYVLPRHVLPLDISKNFSSFELAGIFGGWKELTLAEYTLFAVKLQEFQDAAFVEKIMSLVSRHFAQLSSSEKVMIVSVLEREKCVVTTKGLEQPSKCYFKSVSLFDDLATVNFSNPRSVSENLLKALSVRETVDLQVVFDRLGDLKWDQVQLIKYLASVQDKLTDQEIRRLKGTPIFVDKLNPGMRHLAMKLHAPIDFIESLGLPVLQWTGKWKVGSAEDGLMAKLGLQGFISLASFITLVISSNSHKDRMKLFEYFSANYQKHYKMIYEPRNVDDAFIPTTKEKLVNVKDCYSDENAALMGFDILHSDLRDCSLILGIADAPNPALLIAKMKDNPPSREKAALVFSFMAAQQNNFSPLHWKQLAQISIIPVILEDGSVRYEKCSNVYFMTEQGQNNIYKDFFYFVDFGSSANAFLRACGVKDEPSPSELTLNLLNAPQDFLDRLGIEKYLDILRLISANIDSLLSFALVAKMSEIAFLLGTRNDQVHDHNNQSVHYELAKGKDIYLIDDTVLSQLFKPLGAPIDPILESLYYKLGSKWISNVVSQQFTPSGNIDNTTNTNALQELIKERASILLYDGLTERNSKDVNSGSKEFLQDIQVYNCPKIEIRLTLQGQSQSLKTTACTAYVKKKNVLLVTPDYDYYDVSSAIAKIVLKNPRLKDFLLISTLLSSSLENLRRKGFPVDRILSLKNQKRANAVVSNSSPIVPRKTSGQVENPISSAEKLTEQEKSTRAMSVADKTPLYDKNTTKSILPGSFPNRSPEEPKKISETPNSGITPSPDMLGGLWNTFKKFSNETILGNQQITPHQTQVLKNSLKSMINNSRSTNESEFYSEKYKEKPPLTVQSQCNTLSDQDLVLETVVKGIQLYIDKRIYQEGNEMILNSSDGLLQFADVLLLLCNVFELSPKTVNIYFGDQNTIAFNRQRVLFFNVRYFLGWHYKQDSQQAYYYWFMTFCHELAHHFVAPHNAEHSHYLSSFAENYMERLFYAMSSE